jgi:integrase
MSGHIRRRGERSWELKFDLGRDPATGKRQSRYHSFKGTKREAQAELTRLSAEAIQGTYVDPTSETVWGFLDRWDRDWAATNVSPKTLERYRGIIAKQVRPNIGHLLVQKLRPVHLNELYAKLSREARSETNTNGLSARTVGHVHRVLHRALGHAATWGVVQQNVASLVSPPRVPSTEIEIIREDEIKTVLQNLRGRSMYMIAALGLATGMRRGELLALRWQDVDLEGGKLRVERSLEQTKAGLRFKSPKTKHGRRTITLPASMVAELRVHWKEQLERRLALGAGKAPADALVFPTWDFATRSPNALTKEWSVAMAEAGVAISLHSLRHTHASSLIAAGVDVLTISRRLGHASPTITLGIYGHLFSNTDDRAAQVIEELFAKVRTE